MKGLNYEIILMMRYMVPALAILFAGYLTVVMKRRIEAVVLQREYRIVYRYEMLLCGIVFLCLLDLETGFLHQRGTVLSVLAWVLRLLTVLILAVMAAVVFGGRKDIMDRPKHILVLGLALENGQAPADLLLRLQTALSCAEEYPDADLIVCGGNHDASGCTEAGFMMNWLKEKGISSGRMILEDKSANTIGNFRKAAKLIDPHDPVILVTSSYHMKRAVKMAARAGFTAVGRRPASSVRVYYPANVMWETVLILASFLPGQG